MKHSLSLRFIVLLFLLVSVLAVDNSANISIQLTEPIDLVVPPQFKINSTIPINVVFIGFDESNIDTNQIDNDITHWYAPLISEKGNQYFGSNYTLDMNYHFSNVTTLEDDYITYLSTIFTTTGTLPASLTDYDPSATQALLFPADLAITWLDNNINSYYPGINNSYTLYLIDTYTWGYIGDYYFYTLDYVDPDTGQPTSNPYTIMYGGEYPNRGIFMDLSAGPVNYEESEVAEINEGVSATTIPPIWEYNLPTDKIKLNTNITEYIQETIDLVFTSSYLYDPVIRENFEIEIFLFDDATNSVVSQIDVNIINNAFETLFPTLEVTTSLTVDSVFNFPNLIDEINGAIDPNETTVITGQPVVDYLISNLNDYGMTSNSIPIFIWSWDDDLWFTAVSTLGRAYSDGSGNPAMVMMGYDPSLYPDFGYTSTIIHEVGHIISLRHPHDGFSWDRYSAGEGPVFLDWLRDFISTPMTYAANDVSFSTFDIDNIDRAFTYERINDTWWNLGNANYSLIVDKGYDDFGQTGITSDLKTYLDWTLANKTLSLDNFESELFFDAFYYANLSSYASELYLSEVASLSNYVPPTSTTTTNTTSSSTSSNSTSSSTPSESDDGFISISNVVIISGILILAIRRKSKK